MTTSVDKPSVQTTYDNKNYYKCGSLVTCFSKHLSKYYLRIYTTYRDVKMYTVRTTAVFKTQIDKPLYVSLHPCS